MCPTHVRLRKPGHEGRWSMCSPHVCARCRVGTGSRTSVGRQAKGSQANLEKRELWSRCVGVPLCRRCPAVPAFSRAYHSTPPSGTRVVHSMPPSGAEIGEYPVAGEFRATRRHRVARASCTRRHRVARWGCIQPRLRPAETASSPLSYRAGSPDYCVSSGLVHGTVAVAPTVRRDDRVHLVAEAAPGVATSR